MRKLQWLENYSYEERLARLCSLPLEQRNDHIRFYITARGLDWPMCLAEGSITRVCKLKVIGRRMKEELRKKNSSRSRTCIEAETHNDIYHVAL